MVVTVTAKIKIKPTDSQMEALHQTMIAYRRGCNLVSDIVFASNELKQPALHRMTYQTLRGTIGLRSQMAQSVMKLSLPDTRRFGATATIGRACASRSRNMIWSGTGIIR